MNYQVLLEGRAQKELEVLPGVALKRVDMKLQVYRIKHRREVYR